MRIFGFRDRIRREVDDELQAHIAERVDYYVKRGATPEEARAEALRRFGDFESARAALGAQAAGPARSRFDLRERCYELRQDVRYVARSLRRSPAFTAGIVATLALGLGINSAVFRLADYVLFRPPAGVADARALRWIESAVVFGSGTPQMATTFSYRDARLVADSGVFAMTSAYGPPRLLKGHDGRDVSVAFVDDTFLRMLGATPLSGRVFDAREGAAGAGIGVAIVSFDYWQRQLGGSALNERSAVVLADRTYPIVGVMKPGFTGIDIDPVEVWLPLGVGQFGRGSMNGVAFTWFQTEMVRPLRVVGRPAPGMSDEQLTARLSAAIGSADTDAQRPKRTAILHQIVPVGAAARDQAPNRLLGRLTIVAAIVMLIACANAVNLLLARGVRRHQEIAIRMAIGASRVRVSRLLVIESVMVALAGGAAALIAGRWTAEALRRLLFPDARWTSSAFDERTLLFTAIITLVAGLIAGLAPAWQSTSPDLVTGLKGSRGQSRSKSGTTRAALIVLQTALSCALLVSSGLLVRSLMRLNAVNLGFDPAGLVTASLESAVSRFGGASENGGRRDIVEAPDLAERLRASGRAQTMALASIAPFGATSSTDITVPGSTYVPPSSRDAPLYAIVGPNYFSVMRTRVIQGRMFDAQDATGEPVTIVNASMARRYWDGPIPPGACVMPFGKPCARVVGVVEDIRDAPNGGEPPMRFYLPVSAVEDPPTVLIVRTDERDAPAMATALKTSLPATERATIEVVSDRVDRALRPWHTATLLFSVLGGVALVLACVGVYSVMSCIAAERTRELGIRIVLGATAGDVMRLVLTQGLRLTLIGGAIGLVTAGISGQLLGSLLFDVSRFDPAIYGLGVACLAVAGFCAILPPALRASRVNPVAAVRGD